MTTFLLSNEKVFVEHKKPIVLVDEKYDVAMTVAAILRGATSLGPFRDSFAKDWMARHDTSTRLDEVRRARVKEAAGTAGAIAGMYVKAIGSLTPSGDVVVTIDDLSRHGFRWEQLLSALPLMAFFRKGIKSLIIKLPGGKELRISGTH